MKQPSYTPTSDYRTPAEVLEREPGKSVTGAANGDWRIVYTIWVKVDDFNPRGTGEVDADRGTKARATLNLTARWFDGWFDRLTPSRQLQIDGQRYNIRSVIEGPGQGSERILQLEVMTIVPLAVAS